MTVVEVGAAWTSFRARPALCDPGRLLLRGRNLAYGYVFTGGLAAIEPARRGPAGRRLGESIIPVPEDLGYAEVDADRAVGVRRGRLRPPAALHVKADGVLWNRPAGAGGDLPAGRDPCRRAAAQDHCDRCPRRDARPDHLAPVVRHDGLTRQITRGWPRRKQMAASTTSSYSTRPPRCWMGCPRRSRPAARSTWWARPLGRPVQVDVGRVHYDYVVYVGTCGPDIGAADGPARTGRSCGRAASHGSSAAAGRWAGCTCSACWRWRTARARSSSPNPTWWRPELVHSFATLAGAGGSSSSCSTPNKWRPKILQRRCMPHMAVKGSTTSW